MGQVKVLMTEGQTEDFYVPHLSEGVRDKNVPFTIFQDISVGYISSRVFVEY